MIIRAKIKTRQKSFLVVQKSDDWVISVTSPPEKNRANAELIRELAKRYGSARILAGHASKVKKIELAEKPNARK